LTNDGPAEESLTAANADVALIFCNDAHEWTLKEMMAWAWPEVELTGDAQQHYMKSGTIAQTARDTDRIISIYLLTAEDGAASFKQIMKDDRQTNRFTRIDGSLREAAELLSTITSRNERRALEGWPL